MIFSGQRLAGAKVVFGRFPSLFAVLIFTGFISCVVYIFGANQLCSMTDAALSIGHSYQGKYADQRSLSNDDGRQADKHLAGDLPFILKYLHAKYEQEERKSELAHQQQKRPQWAGKFFCDTKIGDISIAFFTWCLVVVGGLQASRLRQTIATMENYGRSPAFLRRYTIIMKIDGDLPTHPEYSGYIQTRHTVAVDGSFQSLVPAEVFFDAGDVVRLFNSEAKFWIYGHIEYTGTARLNHNHRFALIMVFDGGDKSVRFVPEGPDAYWENT
jgi:hypothetical protein